MPNLPRRGATLFYDSTGDADRPVVTLINGYSRPQSDFKAMSRHLVRKGWRVVTFDNRGAGQSLASEAFSFESLADDVFAIWDELAIAQGHVVGISYGGLIGIHTSRRSPERVKSLSLVSTAPWHGWLKGGERPIPKEQLLSYFSKQFQEKSPVLVHALVQELGKLGLPERRAQLQHQEALLNSVDLRPLVAHISVPTLVLHGEDDEIADVRAARWLAETIPRAELIMVPHIGHLFLAEAPALLYEHVDSFCRRYN